MFMKHPIIQTERVAQMPEMCAGGFLERTHGEICLRGADAVELQEDGQYRVTRTWHRPDEEPFDQNLYANPE